MRRILIGLLLSVIVQFGWMYAPVRGQTQRLGLPVGSFTIEPGGKTSRRGYCMDLGIEAPAPGVELGHLLANANQVEVRIGGGPAKTLTKTIQDGELRLEAKSSFEGMTVSELATSKHLSDGAKLLLGIQKIVHSDLFKKINDLPVADSSDIIRSHISEKKESGEPVEDLDALLRLVCSGDGESVVFVNMTDKQVVTNIKRPFVVSEYAGNADGIVFDNIVPTTSERYDENAWRVWLDNSALDAEKSGVESSTYSSLPEARGGVETFARSGSRCFVLGRNGALDRQRELRCVEHGRIVERLTEPQATERFAEVLSEKVRLASTEDKKFVMVNEHHGRNDGTVDLHIAEKTLRIDRNELVSFAESGEPSAVLTEFFRGASTGEKFIFVRDDLYRLSQERDWSPTKLVLRCQEKFGNGFFLDDDMDASKARLETTPEVSQASDMALLSDAGSFDVDERGIVKAVEDNLDLVGVKTYRGASPTSLVEQGIAVDEPNLMVLVGHKDDAFRDYYEHLVRTGTLRDKVVILFSCYAVGDEDMNSQMFRSENAPKQILCFPETIDATAVAEVLNALAEELEGTSVKDGVEARDLLQRAIEKALDDPNMHPEVRTEIRKLRDVIPQVSLNWHPDDDVCGWFTDTSVGLRSNRSLAT